MLPLIWYIHGAGASPRSFSWLLTQLPEHDREMFTYDREVPLEHTLERLCRTLATVDRPVTVIGHSLGGLLALGATACPQVMQIVTLSAPFGGLPWAGMMTLFSSDPMFADLMPYSAILRRITNSNPGKPHLGIVGSAGLSFLTQPNDGVLTVQSQTALPAAKVLYRQYRLNHFEVLLSTEVAATIAAFAFA